MRHDTYDYHYTCFYGDVTPDRALDATTPQTAKSESTRRFFRELLDDYDMLWVIEWRAGTQQRTGRNWFRTRQLGWIAAYDDGITD